MLNASIFGNMLNAPKSPEEYAAERENLLAARQTNVLNKQKADEYTKGIARQGELRNLLAGGADSSALRQAGFLDEASNWDKNAAEAGLKRSQAMKAEADAKREQIKAASDHLGLIYNAASGAKDQQSYTMALQGLQSAGIDVSNIPQQFDPAYVENAKSQALTQMQRLEQAMKQQEFGLKQNQLGETVRHNKSTEGIQIRGQNLVDARTRDATQATMSKPFEVTGADGQPVLVQQDKQGNIRPVQGYSPKTAADKPLNDSQSKALLFGSRAREADKVLADLASNGTNSSIPGSRAPLIGGVISAFQGGNQQSLDQAKRDFMTAVLRRESGASISPSEFDTADKQYFPQIGDSPQVIKQKAANRRLVIDGILAEVPDKQRGTLSAPTQSNQGPKVGAIEDGHRFKGGDPSNPSNWEKVK